MVWCLWLIVNEIPAQVLSPCRILRYIVKYPFNLVFGRLRKRISAYKTRANPRIKKESKTLASLENNFLKGSTRFSYYVFVSSIHLIPFLMTSQTKVSLILRSKKKKKTRANTQIERKLRLQETRENISLDTTSN